jgi:hypothetical protein
MAARIVRTVARVWGLLGDLGTFGEAWQALGFGKALWPGIPGGFVSVLNFWYHQSPTLAVIFGLAAAGLGLVIGILIVIFQRASQIESQPIVPFLNAVKEAYDKTKMLTNGA